MPEPSAGSSDLLRRHGARLIPRALLPKALRPASGRHRKVATGATVMLAVAAGAVPAVLHAVSGHSAVSLDTVAGQTVGVNQPKAARGPSYQLCNGWASCNSHGYNSYGYSVTKEGKPLWRTSPGVWCTTYVAYVESTVYHVPAPGYLLGNGGDWAGSARAHGVTVNHTPSVGAVTVWIGDLHPGLPKPGHVGVVEQVGPRGAWIIISQQNISGDVNGYEWRYIQKGNTGWEAWPDWFVHFKIPKRALVGYYDPAALSGNFRDSQTAGPVNSSFAFGAKSTIPLVGNWSKTGTGRTGYYDPATGTFYLHNVSTTTPSVSVVYGPPGQAVTPLIGDWKGTGVAGIGYYDPAASTFHLRQALTAGADDFTLALTPPPGTVIPIAGDWNGGAADSVGYYNPAKATFTLLTSVSGTTVYKTFAFGPPNMVPITGNWLGGKTDYVGYYNPANGTFYLRTAQAAGAANIVVRLGPGKMLPLAGDWFGG